MMARNLALETISLQHSIGLDQFDICTVVKNDKLQSICLNLELNVYLPFDEKHHTLPYLVKLFPNAHARSASNPS